VKDWDVSFVSLVEKKEEKLGRKLKLRVDGKPVVFGQRAARAKPEKKVGSTAMGLGRRETGGGCRYFKRKS